MADNELNVGQMMGFAIRNRENILGERIKCCLAAFSSIPTVFFEDLHLKVVHNRDCVVKHLEGLLGSVVKCKSGNLEIPDSSLPDIPGFFLYCVFH